jgi:uncharacterized peroxidase-related enzyme
MRFQEVEKGDGLFHTLLFKFISMVSGMRLPDAARIVMYHQNFYGRPMTEWTHAAMRGASSWSVGERELFAAMTAKWNSCTFCIQAHSAIASLVLDKTLVEAAVDDFPNAKLPARSRSTISFLEKFTKTPDELTATDAAALLQNGIMADEVLDAMAVATLFGITVRLANTINFALLTGKDLSQAAARMLKQGYVFGKGQVKGHPDHRAMAEALQKRVLEEPGITDIALRQAIAKRATGRPAVGVAAYDELAQQIGQGGWRVTDEQVQKFIRQAGSEKAAFELIIAAAVGAGLYRWQKGLSVLEEIAKTDI